MIYIYIVLLIVVKEGEEKKELFIIVTNEKEKKKHIDMRCRDMNASIKEFTLAFELNGDSRVNVHGDVENDQ